MPPAIECQCGDYKVKTPDEPATSKQMEALINRASAHAALAGAQLASLKDSDREVGHVARFHYHETTPTDGSFDKAEVVTR
jgi:hypothetical protein